MPTMTMDVGVVLERRKAKSPWLDVIWEAHAVLAEPAAAEPGAPLGMNGDGELFYGGRQVLEAHTYETPHYRSNLSSGKPQLWVVLRPQAGSSSMPEVVKVTCDPTEGEGYTETGWDTVNIVPMPEPVEAALMAFISDNHVERAFLKRKRDRADPEALALNRSGPEADRVRRERDNDP
jgi:Protein of unknown function (DUF3305)